MFGVSFSKLLLLAVVVAAVWYGFKLLARPDSASKVAGRKPGKPVDEAAAGEGDRPAIEDMVRCPVCGAFQARGAAPCERRDCPARG